MFAVWGYVIANTVASQVELNPAHLAPILGATPERVAAAIAFLAAPDVESRSKINQGRRLIPEGAFAYRVPNHERYRRIRDEADRREYNRVKQREHRARQQPASRQHTSIHESALSAHTEAETETETETGTTTTPSLHSARFLSDAHRTAYERARANAINPVAFDAMLGTIAEPIAGGQAYSWLVIGQALVELATGNGQPNAAAIRAFCRRFVSDDTRSLTPEDAAARRSAKTLKALEEVSADP